MKIQKLQQYLFTGFIILLPVALTFWIISFLISLLTDPFMGFSQKILATVGFQNEQILYLTSKLLILIFLLIIITFVGAIGRYFFFQSFLSIGDSLLQKIPVISSVYKTSRELINTLFSSEHRAFEKVVLVPFPHKDALVLGLVTHSKAIFDDRISVFIPTTPNPTSGYLVFFKKEDVQFIDMKVDDALRFVVSCGVLLENIPQIEKQ